MNKLKLAIWQAEPRLRDVDEFLNDLDTAVSTTDADVLVTPELCWPGYGDVERTLARAAPREGALIAAVRKTAAQHRKAIVFGYAEAEADVCYNSALCIGPDGDVLQNYRKRTTANDYERTCFGTGTTANVFNLCGVPTAVLICYDAEFPELVRNAAVNGARLVIVPTALGSRWRIVSDVVVPTRAYENGIFVAYANYAATTENGSFCGLSLIAGPDGQALVRGGAGPAVILASLDLGLIDEVRGMLHFLGDVDAATRGIETETAIDPLRSTRDEYVPTSACCGESFHGVPCPEGWSVTARNND